MIIRFNYIKDHEQTLSFYAAHSRSPLHSILSSLLNLCIAMWTMSHRNYQMQDSLHISPASSNYRPAHSSKYRLILNPCMASPYMLPSPSLYLPNLKSHWLILYPSFSRSPSDPVFPNFLLPAKFTKYIIDNLLVSLSLSSRPTWTRRR